MADANPDVAQFQLALAMTENNMGNVLYETNDMAGASTQYGQALALRQKLADANPSVTQFQRDLANSHSHIGRLLAETGNTAGRGRPWAGLGPFNKSWPTPAPALLISS